MPFIRIKSPPVEPNLEMGAVLETLCASFSSRSGIDVKHITAIWEELKPDCYVSAGSIAKEGISATHPILVELFAPDLFEAQVPELLNSLADCLASQMRISREHIFIAYQPARSGWILDRGKLEIW